MNRPVLRISRTQLIHNIGAVQQHLAPSTLMLVMKDDAYGHGVETVVDAAQVDVAQVDAAQAARHTPLFGGYDIATSMRIRSRAADGSRIFAWATSDHEEIAQALDSDIELGVGTLPYLERVIAAATDAKKTAKVHLKIDTGLRRNGIRAEDWPDVARRAVDAERAGAIAITGVWSHLAEASDADDDLAAAEFHAAVEVLRELGARPSDLHLTASAASWWRPELRGTVCRVGAFCYGIRSADGPEIPGVRPIAALEATVIGIESESVRIAIGALDGLPSTLSAAPAATPAGLREILRIDDVSTSVQAWPGAHIGQRVRIFGPGDLGEVDATTLAERIDTVGEEIITRLTSRVRRVMED